MGKSKLPKYEAINVRHHQSSLCSCDTAKDFLNVVDEKLLESNKAEVGNLMNSIINDKYGMFAEVEFSL